MACPVSSSSPPLAPPRRSRLPSVSATPGVSQFAAIAGSGVPPAPKLWFGPPFSPSDARGVDQDAATVRRSGPPSPWLPGPFVSLVRTVGHDEQPLALVAGAGFGRAENSCRNAETHCLQCWDEGGELSVRVPRDVLAEETISPAFAQDPQDLVDEEAVVAGAAALAGDGVGLAGVSAKDAMNAAAPRASVEGGKVRPDRSVIQLARLAARDQPCGGKCFPLQVSDSARSGFGNMHAEVEPAGPGAEGEDVEGAGRGAVLGM